ncbi:MAG: AAA family ATPase, partial [Planctomycetota bacterium]|nr:AAA family ATPase [Planctomycetota bacterium]
MSAAFTAILVDADPANRDDVAQVLGSAGVAIAVKLDHVDELSATLRRNTTSCLVIVNLEPEPRETVRRLGSIIHKFPAASFVAMARGASVELVIDVMDVGVKAFIPLPLDRARLVGAIERLVNDAAGSRRAKVIQFVPTIGGCGATTIACGVAATLAKLGKTLIVDLDLVRGAVANGFDVRPRQSIADVAGSGSQLDKAKLDAAVAVHRELSLAVLARPEAPEDAQRVTREGLEQLLAVAGAAYDFVVIDSALSLDPVHGAVTRAADVNVPVMQLSVPSAKNTERYLHALRRMGIDAAGTTRIIVNRFAPERSDIQPSEIERALGLKIAWTLPNDFPTAMGSINFGEPVTQRSPRTELSRSLVGLAQSLAARVESA